MVNELSLFTGYGGFSLGLRLAGLQTRTVMYVEWERYPQEIIKARIKDGYLDDAPIWGDISTLDGWQLRGVVDIITAGFPCQPHSVAGLKQGAGDERNLWPETLRIIREVGPRYVILENVPGILSASADGGTPAYGGTVVGELASIGYSVHWRTIGADDVGAPHRRKRWWCIGVANTTGTRLERPEHRVPRDAAESGSELDDPEHNGHARPQETGSLGQGSIWIKEGQNPTEQPTGSGISSARADDLADSECFKWGNAHGHQPGDSTEGTRERQPDWLGGGSESVADSDCVGSTSDTRDYGEERSLSEAQRQPEHGPPIPGRGGPELADSDSHPIWDGQQLQGQRRPASSAQSRAGHADEELADIPTWPPSPSDADGWAGLLAERPDLAPALDKEVESRFRGVDDGRSHRVDELKAIGNGIVPSVVAEFLLGLTKGT